MTLELSDHAAERSAQRNVSGEEIRFIVKHGKRVHRTGVIYCQMLKKRMPDLPASHPYWRLVGTTVLLSNDDEVITVYRGENAFKADRRKAKYDRRKRLRHIA